MDLALAVSDGAFWSEAAAGVGWEGEEGVMSMSAEIRHCLLYMICTDLAFF